MLRLLAGVRDRLITPAKYTYALNELDKIARVSAGQYGFSQIFEERRHVQNWFVTHADPAGKSGGQVVRQYRIANRIYEKHCGDPKRIMAAAAAALTAKEFREAIIVVVDDFVGSGQSGAADVSNNILPLFREYIAEPGHRALLLYAAIVGYERGLERIIEALSTDGSVVCYRYLSETDKAFSPENNLFETVDQRLRARDIAANIGSSLEKNHPLGWEDSQGLIVFPESVPNNTLPILWKVGAKYKGRPWTPLFPRS